MPREQIMLVLKCALRLQEEQAGNIDSELATVISSIALACKQISSLVTRSGISNLTGAAGGANFSVCCPCMCLLDQCRRHVDVIWVCSVTAAAGLHQHSQRNAISATP